METNMILKKIFNYLFIVSMLMLPALGLFKFHQYMDYYEMFILVGTGLTFIWMSNYWQSFKYLVTSVLALSFISIFLYEGNLLSGEEQFILKYFLSSQSAIMWMCSLYPLSLLMYWFYLFKKQAFFGNFASQLTWIATAMGFIGLLVRWFESYLISIDVGHIPISNLYEVFVLFCLITALLHLYYEEKMNRKELGAFVL
jgi:hypothetical protein